jgi:hypothetical protein
MKRTIVMVVQRHNGYTQQRWWERRTWTSLSGRIRNELPIEDGAGCGGFCRIKCSGMIQVMGPFAKGGTRFPLMHRCLQIPEILGNICRYLYLLPQWIIKGRKLDLLAFALVCKAFLEPSLGILWESDGSFTRLIKTFPTDAWCQGGYTPTIVS